MCGIVGFVNGEFHADKFSSVIVEMLSMQMHRGPDEFGYYVDEKFAIGAARLSIVDIANGHQPMSDFSKRFWIAYNGEIYNHVEIKNALQNEGVEFFTNTDTEVVLNAWILWGIDGIARLDGAFSFVIYDKKLGKLYLVRDRFGEKPLYYFYQFGSIIFSSEIKSFLKYPNFKFRFNIENIKSVFLTWTGFGESTVFEGIKKISPGCYLEFTLNDGISIHKYDTFEDSLRKNKGIFKGSFDEAKEQVRFLLSKSVKNRLPNEVSAAIYLSGGIDSSIIAKEALANSIGQLNTFSISFNQSAYDESKDQLAISKYLGSNHHSILVTNELISKNFSEAVWHAEIPLFRSAPVPMLILSKYVSRSGFKVALTGEGADEIFLGYDLFKEVLVRSEWEGTSENERLHAIENIYKYMGHYKNSNNKIIQNHFSRIGGDRADVLFSHLYRFNNSKIAMRIFLANQFATKKTLEKVSKEFSSLSNLDLLERAQCLETETLLSSYLLSSQGDRMVMASSVEGRCPFLGKDIVDFANSLPLEYKLKNKLEEKHILKSAYSDLLPEFVLKKNKRPYRSPDSIALMSGDAWKILNKFIPAAYNEYAEVFDIDFCQALISKVKSAASGSVSIGPGEDSAFVLLTSLAYLHDFFIDRNFPENKKVCPPIMVSFRGNLGGS